MIEASNGLLYGAAAYGGINDNGTLFNFDPVLEGFNKLIDFNISENGDEIYGSLTQASNGRLYGMTRKGGMHGMGVLFEYDHISNTIINKADFNGNNGIGPKGSLIQATNGKLYGMTESGGASGYLGVIFEYDISTNILSKKVDLDLTSGSQPRGGSLIEASNGKLYGVTFSGGVNYKGTLFEYDISAEQITVLFDFNDSDGRNPAGSLIEVNNKLFGMTSGGGQFGEGVIFEYDLITDTYVVKHNFEIENGRIPYGSLVLANNGLLYGMTISGGQNTWGGVAYNGVLFEFNPVNGTFTKKIDFDDTNKGRTPFGSLVESSNDLLYGMTTYGGANGFGVLFEFDPSDGSYTKKLDFDGTNGKYPYYTQLIEVVVGSEWTGNNSSDWTDAGNWEFDEVPNPVMDVTIPPTYMNPPIIDQEAVAHDMTIDGGNLQIIEGGQLTLSGDLNNNGFFEIKSNMLGTGSFIDNGTLTGSGSYSVERFVGFDGWHLIGAPIASATAAMFTGMYLQSYDEPGNAWVDITDENTPLFPMTGYSLWQNTGGLGETYYFYGDPNTGTVSMPVSADNPYGWNLLSNPYTSTIDWDLVDKTDINNAIYYWDPVTGNYVSYNAGVGSGDRYVPYAQGFFVSAPAAGTLSFDNSVRSHGFGSNYYKSSSDISNYLELKATGNNREDKAFLRFKDNATSDFDGDYDAYKIFSFVENVPQVYFMTGEHSLSIHCLPETTSVDVGFSAGSAGEYSISLDELNDIGHAVLEDKLNGVKTDLQQNSYTFQYNTADLADRFILHFSPLAVEETAQGGLQVYSSGNTLYINSKEDIAKAPVRVMDLKGSTMEEFDMANTNRFNKTLSLPTGYYLVSIQTGTEVLSKKVFIK